MRRSLLILCHWLHQLALAVWLGGIVTMGAVSAHAIFGTAKAKGHTEWGMPLYTFAGEALGEAFRRFNYLVLAAGALALIAGIAYGVLDSRGNRGVGVRALLTGAGWAVAAWLTFGLYPQLLAARASGEMALFDRLHKTYTAAFSLQMLLLLGVMGLTAFLDLARQRAAPEALVAEGARPEPARGSAPAAHHP